MRIDVWLGVITVLMAVLGIVPAVEDREVREANITSLRHKIAEDCPYISKQR